jgi:hypothetical protein
MSEENQPREYKVELELASGANLEMLMFSDTEHRWIFKHRYMHPEKRERLEKPTLVNDTTLVVNYDGGVAQDCNLTMNIVRPDKRGKRYFLGVDISEGSHLFAEFIYEKQGDLYRMKAVDLGMHGRVDLDSLCEGLVKPVDFPFPLKDSVENEFGVYRVPFLRNDGEQAFFEFPKDYRKQF